MGFPASQILIAVHAVVIQSTGLLHARIKAALAGADQGLEFVSGHQLDQESASHIPVNTIGRFLNAGDLRKLQRMLSRKSRLRHRCDGGPPQSGGWASREPAARPATAPAP
jgi:hypothetical protein